jgi:aspartate/tyrosine/aromatic aminotransferase
LTDTGNPLEQIQMKNCIRANYSNPPGHGAAIVTTVLSDAELCGEWEAEVDAMRDRINRMRHLLVETLAAKGVTRDFSFINRQRGMFFSSGLTREQANTLREKYSIYILFWPHQPCGPDRGQHGGFLSSHG